MRTKFTFSCWLALFFIGIMTPTFTTAQCGDTISGLFTVSSFPYKETFESGPNGWWTAPVDSLYPANAPTAIANQPRPNTWAFGNPSKRHISGAYSGDSCWTTGGLGTGAYAQLERSFVASPYFDLSGLTDPYVGMRLAYSSFPGEDFGYLEASTDTGKTWSRVGAIGTGVEWYNSSTNFSIVCPNPTHGWAGTGPNSSRGWTFAFHDIGYLVGAPLVQFRVFFSSNVLNHNEDGIAFDDFVIGEKFTVNLGADTALCFGNILQLDLGNKPKGSYAWQRNFINAPLDTTQFLRITTNPQATAGVFIGCATDSLGYTACDTITVSYSQTQLMPLPPATIICPGDSTTLFSGFNPGATATWYAIDSSCLCYTQVLQGPNLTTDTTAQYRIVLTDNLGCVERDTASVVVERVPDVDIGADDTICVGTAKILSAPSGDPGTNYTWTLNNSPFAQTQTIFGSAPGKYKVVLTTNAGCQDSDSMNLLVVLAPVISLGADYITCDTVFMDAGNPGSTYLWNNGSTARFQKLYPPFSAWVSVTNSSGCNARDTVNVQLGTAPVVNLGGDRIVCNSSSVTLDAGAQAPGAVYNWSDGPPNTRTRTITQPGFFFCTVIDTNDCRGSDSVNITISQLRVDLGPDTVVCVGNSIVLDATATVNATYKWNTNATTPMISVNTGGTYGCILQDTLGCTVSDSVIVAQGPLFNGNFTVGPDTFIVFNTSVKTHTFTAVNFPAGTNSFIWDFGDGNTAMGQTVQHEYTSLDTFTVCLILSDGQCSDTVCGIAGNYLKFLDGIEDDMGLTLDVFPNPSNGQFMVDMKFLQPTRVHLGLYDLKGRLVADKRLPHLSAQRERIDLSGASKGIYLLKLETERGTAYRKLVLK